MTTNKMIRVDEEKEAYLAEFERVNQTVSHEQPLWLQELRQDALDRFTELNFPTVRDEDWRFTNLSALLKIPFRASVDHHPITLISKQVEPFLFGQPKWNRIVFIDGLYAEKLSSLQSKSEAVRIERIRRIGNSELWQDHLARYVDSGHNIFAALNTAFIRDGALVYIPSGKVVEEPIHLLFLSSGAQKETISSPRSLIIADRGSMATIIESHGSLYDGTYFTNALTEVVLGEGAFIDYYKIQQEGIKGFHIATTHAELGRNSNFSSFSFDAGAKLARNNLNVLLNSEGSECALNGLYFVSDNQHIDNHTAIDHARPHGTSREFYKGILDATSKAVFNGKIIVRKDAQKTDAKQTNKNLVLSDDSQVSTIPQLEILADDVKCTHGATVGQLSEEAIFYLKSRGISSEAARSILTLGFASEIINQIKVKPVQARLNSVISRKLQERGWTKEAL